MIRPLEPLADVIAEKDFLEVFMHSLQMHTSYDLSDYSNKSLRRRVQKVLEQESLTLTQLCRRIEHDPGYAEFVVNRITVNTSELFRDPAMWQEFRSRILPRFREQARINIWHAGCSMGQEVYSHEMLLNELDLLDRSHIYASDINSEILKAAKEGIYRYRFNLGYLDNFEQVIRHNPLNYEEEIDTPYERYMQIDKQQDIIRIHKFLRDKPVFRQNDLVKAINPFYVKFDIIFCRNVIIYFNTRLQNRIFDLFYRNMYPGGVLVLGAHEFITGPWSDRFMRTAQVYIRKEEF